MHSSTTRRAFRVSAHRSVFSSCSERLSVSFLLYAVIGFGFDLVEGTYRAQENRMERNGTKEIIMSQPLEAFFKCG